MDLLFKRYASPFLLLDEMILMRQFSDFVEKLIEFDTEDKRWDYYVHRVEGQSYSDWKESIGISSIPNNDFVSSDGIETTLNDAFSIINNFKPL